MAVSRNLCCKAIQVYIFLFLLVFALLLPHQGEAQWRPVFTGSTDNNEVKAVHFLNPSTGFVGFDKFIGFTVDSGHTFVRRYISMSNVDYNGYYVNLTFGFSPSGIHAFSTDSLLVYGDYGFEPSILFSANGGQTWKLVFHLPYNSNAPVFNQGVTDIEFPGNTATGIAIHHEGIYRTTNRGQSWTAVLTTPNQQLQKLSFPSATTGYAIGKDRMYKTTNGGTSWSAVTLPTTTNVDYNQVFFTTPGKGYITESWGLRIFYTTDGGATWKQQNDKEQWPVRASDLHFINDSTGFASNPFAYVVLKTDDYGRTWEECKKTIPEPESGSGLNDLFFIGEDLGWAGGYSEHLFLNTNAFFPTLPEAHFTIDTNGVYRDNVVDLVNQSKKGYQYQWYRNGVLISSSYNASYTHEVQREKDTLQLVVSNGIDYDTTTIYQYFTVPPLLLPTITSFTPTTGSTGTVVTITGTNLDGTSAVSFGGVEASSFTVVSPTSVTAVVAAGTTGAVAVTTARGRAEKDGFIYTTQLRVHSFDPVSGPLGSTVTITGTDFSPIPTENIVYFGDVRAPVMRATATQVVVTVPAGASYKPISVTTGGRTAYSRLPFVVTFPGGGAITAASYPTKIDSATGPSSIFLATGDLDGDGRTDAVTGIFSALDRIAVHRNTSTLSNVSFEVQKHYELNAGYNGEYGPVVIADMNSDGKPDILAKGRDYLHYLHNTSTGATLQLAAPTVVANTYNFQPENLYTGELNGDGKTDVFGIDGNKLYIYKNTGTGGSFSLAVPLTITLPNFTNGGCTLSDFDGDGKDDIALVTYYSGQHATAVYRNTSNAGSLAFALSVIVPIGDYRNKVAAGDLDGDGKPDLVAARNAPGLSVARNTSTPGSLSFAAKQDFPTGYSITSLALGDLNGDGRPDIAASINLPELSPAEDVQVSLLENRSTPGVLSFGPQVDLALDSQNHNTLQVALADFNGDGRLEVATVNPATNNISIFFSSSVVSKEVCVNGSVTFTAGKAGATYRWQQNTGSGFVDISDNGNQSGTQSATLQLANIPANWNSYQYRCAVDGEYSQTFSLLVRPSAVPSLTITATADTTCAGMPVTFTATPTNGGTAPTYRWQVDGVEKGPAAPTFTTNELVNGSVVKATITSNQVCISNPTATSNELALTILPLTRSEVSITASNTSVCAGIMVTFTATVSGAGSEPSYIWQVNGSDAAYTKQFSTTSLEQGSQVRLIVGSSALCAANAYDTSAVITMAVRENPAPVVTAAGATTLCAGESVRLTASGSGQPQWFKDGSLIQEASQTSLTVQATGRYTATLTSNGCTSAPSNPVSVTVNPLPPAPAITPSGAASICEGKSLVLQTPLNSRYSYQWYKDAAALSNATASSYTAASAGSYSVKVTENGCSSTSPATAVTVQPSPPVPTITANGSVLSSSAATGNQWYLNGAAISGATGQQYTATQAGQYTVQVTAGGCSSQSAVFNFATTGIVSPGSWNSEIAVFPNPVERQLFIRYTAGRTLLVQIVDARGNRVKETRITGPAATVNLEGLSSGSYILLLTDVKKKETIAQTLIKL